MNARYFRFVIACTIPSYVSKVFQKQKYTHFNNKYARTIDYQLYLWFFMWEIWDYPKSARFHTGHGNETIILVSAKVIHAMREWLAIRVQIKNERCSEYELFCFFFRLARNSIFLYCYIQFMKEHILRVIRWQEIAWTKGNWVCLFKDGYGISLI